MELIPSALGQCIKDVIMFRDMREDSFMAAQVKSIINERICTVLQNQVICVDAEAVHDAEPPPAAATSGQQAVEWANSFGYGPTQGAVGKSGAGKGWGGNKDQKGDKGRGFGKDQKGKDQKGGQGSGKGERPVGAYPHCWGFGH